MDVPGEPIILQSEQTKIELPQKLAQQSPILRSLTQGPLKENTFRFKTIGPEALEYFGRFIKVMPHSKKIPRNQFYLLTKKLPEFSLRPNLKMSKDIILDLVAISDILDLPIMNEFLGYYLANRIMPYFDMTQQPAIRGYFFVESELAKLTEPIKKEIARSYYLSYGRKLNLGVKFGFSITELAKTGRIPYSKTQILDLSGLNINSLDGLVAVAGIKNTRTLILSNNQIKKIPANIFTILPLIFDLRLNDNQVKTIEQDAFKNHTFLKLDLSNNMLEEISKEALGNFNAVDRLNLKGNPVKKIEPSIFQMTIGTIGLPNTSAAQQAKQVFEQVGIEVF